MFEEKNGAPGEIRTPDLMLRRHSLYPAELRARSLKDTALGLEPRTARQARQFSVRNAQNSLQLVAAPARLQESLAPESIGQAREFFLVDQNPRTAILG